jgi:hypothetical protein
MRNGFHSSHPDGLLTHVFRLLLGRVPLPFPLGDRRTKPGQHDFELTHGRPSFASVASRSRTARRVRISMTSATRPALDVRRGVIG